MKTNQKKSTAEITEMVTALIISKLEQGIVPWKKPWKGAGMPVNFITKKPYRGINLLILYAFGHEVPYYLTFRQAQDAGGHIRKGASSIPIIYWNYYYRLKGSGRRISDLEAVQTDPDQLIKSAFLKYYRVFNIEDCEGIEFEKTVGSKASDPEQIENCEQIVHGMPDPPQIINHGNGAYYSPLEDRICIPKIKRFESGQAYYNVLFHEMIHSTGHESRLAREGVLNMQGFASDSYSKEELIAEMGAGILAGYTGISDDQLASNSAAYIKCWLERLKSDKNMLIEAAGKAQRAVDYVLDICPF